MQHHELILLLLISIIAFAECHNSSALRIRFCLITGPLGDLSWSFSHNMARLEALRQMRQLFPGVYFDSRLEEASDLIRLVERQRKVISDFTAQDNCNVILFAHETFQEDPSVVMTFSKQYPNVTFVLVDTNASSRATSSYNVVNLRPRYGEGLMVMGYAATAFLRRETNIDLPRQNCVGIIIGQTFRNDDEDLINSFCKGVSRALHSSVSTNNTSVIVTRVPSDPSGNTTHRAVDFMFNQLGCRVVGGLLRSHGLVPYLPLTRDEAAGTPIENWTFGTFTNHRSYASDAVVASLIMKWERPYVDILTSVVLGNRPASDVWAGGLSEGWLDVTEVHEEVSLDERLQAKVLLKDIKEKGMRDGDNVKCLGTQWVTVPSDCPVGHRIFLNGTYRNMTCSKKKCPMGMYAVSQKPLAILCLPCETCSTPTHPAEKVTRRIEPMVLLAIMVGPVGIVLLAYLGGWFLYYLNREVREATDSAPRVNPVVLCFAEIEWGPNIIETGGDIDPDAEAIRKVFWALSFQLLKKHYGYASVRQGERGFCFAFDTARNGLNFALDLQVALLDLELPPIVYNRMQDQVATVMNAEQTCVLFRGLRVQMALHVDLVQINDMVSRITYEGAAVVLTNQLCNAACGGQILMSRAIYDAVLEHLNDMTLVAHVKHEGRFISEKVGDTEVYSVLPLSLLERAQHFPQPWLQTKEKDKTSPADLLNQARRLYPEEGMLVEDILVGLNASRTGNMPFSAMRANSITILKIMVRDLRSSSGNPIQWQHVLQILRKINNPLVDEIMLTSIVGFITTKRSMTLSRSQSELSYIE